MANQSPPQPAPTLPILKDSALTKAETTVITTPTANKNRHRRRTRAGQGSGNNIRSEDGVPDMFHPAARVLGKRPHRLTCITYSSRSFVDGCTYVADTVFEKRVHGTRCERANHRPCSSANESPHRSSDSCSDQRASTDRRAKTCRSRCDRLRGGFAMCDVIGNTTSGQQSTTDISYSAQCLPELCGASDLTVGCGRICCSRVNVLVKSSRIRATDRFGVFERLGGSYPELIRIGFEN